MATKIVMRQRSALKLRFQAGAVGPSGTVTVIDTITGAPGTDAEVANTGTPSDALLTFTIPRGNTGLTGDKGWSPILAVVTDGLRRVLQINDWTGGEGTKPATGSYIGASGLVSDIANAVDIRGAVGPAGSVTDGDKGDITVSSSGTVWTVDGGYVPATGGAFSNSITVNTTLRLGHFNGTSQIQNLQDNSAGRVLDLADFPNLSTASATVRFFRGTTTSGSRNVAIFRGDGSATADHQLTAGTSGTLADFCRNGGNALVGGNLVWHAGNTNDIVTNAKLANMAQNTIKGRVTASTGDPEDLTPAQIRAVASALAVPTSATPITTTSGTSHEWTGLPAGVTQARVHVRGISTNGTNVIGIRIGPSGGVVSTGYVGSASQIANASSPSVSAISTLLPIILAPAAASIIHGTLDLELIDAGSNIWRAVGSFATTTGVMLNVTGEIALAGALARIMITTASGTDTFDAGTAYLTYTAP